MVTMLMTMIHTYHEADDVVGGNDDVDDEDDGNVGMCADYVAEGYDDAAYSHGYVDGDHDDDAGGYDNSDDGYVDDYADGDADGDDDGCDDDVGGFDTDYYGNVTVDDVDDDAGDGYDADDCVYGDGDGDGDDDAYGDCSC